MAEPTDKAMTPDERYLGIAQEVYLHAVKTFSSSFNTLEINPTLLRERFNRMAAMADEAAAAFNDCFETGDE